MYGCVRLHAYSSSAVLCIYLDIFGYGTDNRRGALVESAPREALFSPMVRSCPPSRITPAAAVVEA